MHINISTPSEAPCIYSIMHVIIFYRRSCFSKLCCCCCTKENGGVHDLRDDCTDDDMREQESKKHKGEMRRNEMPAIKKEMVLEDHTRGETLHMDEASSEKKKGPEESIHEEGKRPSEDKRHAEERQHEEKVGADAEGQSEQEKRKPKEGQLQSHELERQQHDEVLHLKTRLQIMERYEG